MKLEIFHKTEKLPKTSEMFFLNALLKLLKMKESVVTAENS